MKLRKSDEVILRWSSAMPIAMFVSIQKQLLTLESIFNRLEVISYMIRELQYAAFFPVYCIPRLSIGGKSHCRLCSPVSFTYLTSEDISEQPFEVN